MCVRRWWGIWWRGGEAEKPLEERTLGNSKRSLEIHFGVERRLAWRGEDDGGEEVRHKEGEELQKPSGWPRPREDCDGTPINYRYSKF